MSKTSQRLRSLEQAGLKDGKDTAKYGVNCKGSNKTAVYNRAFCRGRMGQIEAERMNLLRQWLR